MNKATTAHGSDRSWIVRVTENLTFGRKFAVALAFPVLGLLYFSGAEIKDRVRVVGDSQAFEELVGLATRASAVVHETQKERGMTASFLGSAGERYRSELPAQRAAVDEKSRELIEFVATIDLRQHGSAIASRLDATLQSLDSIQGKRAAVDSLSLASSDAIKYYTGINEGFLFVIGQLSKVVARGEMANQTASYYSLLSAKEAAGIERAVLSSAFARDSFEPGQYEKAKLKASQQITRTDVFMESATEDHVEFYRHTVQGDCVEQVEAMRSVIKGRAERKATFGRLIKATGYGGIIHNFKNQVLRGSPAYREKVASQRTEVTELVAVVKRLLPENSSHRADLDVFMGTLEKYWTNSERMDELLRSGLPVEEIDAKVTVDEGPALAALDRLLSTEGFGVDAGVWFASATERINLLREVENELSSDLLSSVVGYRASAHSAMWINSLVVLVVLGVALWLAVVISRGVSRSANQLVDVMSNISAGDLTVRIDLDTTDEMGQMARALNETTGHFRGVMSTVRQTGESLGTASLGLTETSGAMRSFATGTSSQAQQVADASAQISQSLVTVAGGVEEMTVSISEIARSASEAAGVAADAVAAATDANETFGALGEASTEIGNVIKVITSIAEQTNLLALNATIEAARAGEAGKGFAVVANEVKELASETATATSEIGTRIEAIQSGTYQAAQAIDRIQEVIQRVNDIQSSIASAVEEQTATTSDISRNVAESATGSAEIASNVAEVANAASETTHGAMSVQTSSKELSDLATDLKRVVAGFTC